jgi:hypothetical protein
VKQVAVQDHGSPGQNLNNREFKTYRPRVQRDQDSQQRSAPTKIENLNNVKPPSERYQGGSPGNQKSGGQSNGTQGKPNQTVKKKGNKKDN